MLVGVERGSLHGPSSLPVVLSGLERVNSRSAGSTLLVATLHISGYVFWRDLELEPRCSSRTHFQWRVVSGVVSGAGRDTTESQ